MNAALLAHEHAMAEARANGDLRTIRGVRYPVSDRELESWLAAQRGKEYAFLKHKYGAQLAHLAVYG